MIEIIQNLDINETIRIIKIAVRMALNIKAIWKIYRDLKTKKITNAEALLKLTLIGMRVTATITNQIADP